MSAIWGTIDLNEKRDEKLQFMAAKQIMEGYKVDRVEEYQDERVNIGCAVQYFSQFAKNEQLPLVEDGIYFTADMLIDNREELLPKLSLDLDSQIGDAKLFYDLYKKKGDGLLDDVLGAFTFVYYDQKENCITMGNDICACRCLYYSFEDGVLRFSTSLKPLVQALKPQINERWVADFLGMDNLAGMTETEETMYCGIYKLPPAHIFKVSRKGIEKTCYWEPRFQTVYGVPEEELKKEYLQVWSAAVERMVRFERNTMLLSGGLDSNSIAAIAAPYLKKQGKTLYTYTSVPREGFEMEFDGFNVTDESHKVLQTAEYFGNLSCSFVSMDGVDTWKEHTREMEYMEIPYKSLQNYLWITECMRQTYEAGGRVILNGGYGNVTISYEDVTIMFNSLLKKKKFVEYFRQCKAFGRACQMRKKDIIKSALKTAKGYYINPAKPSKTKRDILGDAYVTDEMVKKYDMLRRFDQVTKKMQRHALTEKDLCSLLNGTIQFAHKGEAQTKNSLATGVINRDVCMDRRLIEFCMKLPMSAFCKDGITRRLVRVYLEGIVPDHINKVIDHGYQGADMKDRLADSWEDIKKEWTAILERNLQNKIVDCKRALEDVKRFDQDWESVRDFEFMRLGYTIMVLEKIEECSRAK